MMVEYGEHFWRDGWGSLYSVFGGNPLAAMPSLHFATSVMAALLLAEVGPVAGALGFAYTATLGFALVYLGEHYVVDLLAGAALTRRGAPAGAARGTGRRARWGARSRRWRRWRTRRAERRGEREERWSGASDAGTQRGRARQEVLAPRRRRRAAPPRRRCRACCSRAGRSSPSRCSSSPASRFLYFVLPKLAGVGTTVHRIERRRHLVDRDRRRARAALVRRLRRRCSAPCSCDAHPPDARGSAGARAMRSRWPAWPPRACSRPPARAASR